MPLGQASGATCIQKLDDSQNSAIHSTYCISLHSSSLREPRYPLLRVVCYYSRFASPRRQRTRPRGGEGRLRLARSNMVRGAFAGQKLDFHSPSPAVRSNMVRGASTGQKFKLVRLRPPGKLAAKGPNLHRKLKERTRRQALRTGPACERGTTARVAPRPHAELGRTKECSQGLSLCVCNDPFAGSPMETLLRLLLPLNDKV